MIWEVKQSAVGNGSAYARVFIHPASLCLLVGAFNLFTFKVFIDMYDPSTIFLIVLGLLPVDLSLLLFPA